MTIYAGSQVMVRSKILVVMLLFMLWGTCGVTQANECSANRISVKDVCGKVVTSVRSEPIPDADVTVMTRAEVPVKGTHVDLDGIFSVSPIPKGDYLLRVTAAGFDTILWPIRVSKGKADCKRLIVVSLAPFTGMGCMSGITAIKPNPPRK